MSSHSGVVEPERLVFKSFLTSNLLLNLQLRHWRLHGAVKLLGPVMLVHFDDFLRVVALSFRILRV